MNEGSGKRAEFIRLIMIPTGVLLSMACINYFRFGDLYSMRDAIALRPLAGVAVSKQLAGDETDGVRIDTLSVRNLTLGNIRILGLQNSCGPCIGNSDMCIPPLSAVTLKVWDKASDRHPVYKIFSNINREPLEIELTD